jgi:hypothetical protein
MSYQHERDQFVSAMTREGLPLHVAEALLRAATGFNRRAELACSSEAADRDHVHCPAGARGKGPCLCDAPPLGEHEQMTRITRQDWQAEQRLIRLLTADAPIICAVCSEESGAHGSSMYGFVHKQGPVEYGAFVPLSWARHTAGDPRGYTLSVIPPSEATRNQGKDQHNRETIGVPSRPSRIQW